MQVLCKPTNASPDIKCPVCGQGFLLYWERSSRDQQDDTLPNILQVLREHHNRLDFTTHPGSPFNIPSWSGLPQFSAAALLGGAAL